MLSAARKLYNFRHILLVTTMCDIRAKYMGTRLGIIWSFLFPLLFLSLYALVYTFILKVRIADLSTFDYVLIIFSGLIPFLGFSEALGSGVSSVSSNASLTKNTLFPIEIIPVKAVLTSSVTMLVGLCMLLPTLWFNGYIYWTQLFIFPVLLMQIIFTCGLMWLLSALNVIFKDISQTVPIVILFLMLVSPIGYTKGMIPEDMMVIMYPNPLYYLTTLYRDCTMGNQIPLETFGIFTVIAFCFFSFGYFIFSRLKPVFVDYI